MTLDLSALLPGSDPKPQRLLIEVELKPVQGSRFQPTGFPDLGPAIYQTPEGTKLLVESPQSMANRLEAVCWDGAQQELVTPLAGLPYIRVTDSEGRVITSSVTEAHRINSPYVLESADRSFFESLRDELKRFESETVDRPTVAKILFGVDAGSLLHGVFLAKKELAGGRVRVERALSSFIEAENVMVAASGGVKNDPLDVSGDTGKGFGNVPFQRDEYTAERIVAYFNLDLAQIRGYALGARAEELLVALGLFKVQAFLQGNLRLRTACDFDVVSTRVTRPTGFELPSLDALRRALPELIMQNAHAFRGKNGVTTVVFKKAG